MVTELEKAWLAGFFDGEGSATIYRQSARGTKTVAARMTFTNTHRPTIDRVLDILDGIGVTRSVADARKAGNPLHKRGWNVRILRIADILRLCEAIRPYVVTKAAQLDVMMHYARTRLSVGEVGEDGKIKARFVSDERAEVTEWAIVEIQRLNRRGPVHDEGKPAGESGGVAPALGAASE